MLEYAKKIAVLILWRARAVLLRFTLFASLHDPWDCQPICENLRWAGGVAVSIFCIPCGNVGNFGSC